MFICSCFFVVVFVCSCLFVVVCLSLFLCCCLFVVVSLWLFLCSCLYYKVCFCLFGQMVVKDSGPTQTYQVQELCEWHLPSTQLPARPELFCSRGLATESTVNWLPADHETPPLQTPDRSTSRYLHLFLLPACKHWRH